MKCIKYLGFGVLALGSLTSCHDFLDPDNKSTGNSDGDAYLKNNPTALRATAYNEFSGFATEVTMHDQAADLYINPRSSNDGSFSQFTINASDGSVKSYYQKAYKAINYANAMIAYNGLDTQLGWEAQFLRAYGYYLLTQQFGAVPYILHYIADANREYPRVPVADIYAGEIATLENLYNNSGLESTNHQGTVSKQAVAALLTQYYLAAGWDLDTEIVNDEAGTYSVKSRENFAKAAAWAEKAINGVSLTMTFADKWSPFNENNAEEIFSFQYLRDPNISRGHSLQNDYIAWWGDTKNTGMKGSGSGGTNMPSVKSLYLFEKGDQRWEATYMTTYYNAPAVIEGGIKQTGWGDEGYFAAWNCTPEKLATKPIAYKYWPWYVTEEEAEAELAAIKDQTKKFETDAYGINKPQAAILLDDDVVLYTFKEDGSWDKEYLTFDKFYGKPDGNGACVKKFDDPASAQVNSGADYRDVPLFHVSDMYLYAAEAYLMADKSGEALTKVNAVRTRAGLPALASFGAYTPTYTIPSWYVPNDLDLILDERARELYAERTRWFDLRRTKQLVRYNLAFARSITEKSQMCNAQGEVKWYRPIPEAEIVANTALSSEDQNPGY